MGCTSGFRCEANTPVQDVAIESAFALSVYEITRGEFRTFVERASYRPDSEEGSASVRISIGCLGFTLAEFRASDYGSDIKRHTWLQPGFSQTDNHPVVCITWRDASAYVQWLALETGRLYRLPSEAEWEYSARAGARDTYLDTSLFCNEKDPDDIRRCVGDPYTEVVGHSGPNAFGLYDMNRNAFEWVEDCWTASFDGAPVDGSARIQENCQTRVFRGGGWGLRWVQHESRDAINNIRRTTNQMGFRVAQSTSE